MPFTKLWQMSIRNRYILFAFVQLFFLSFRIPLVTLVLTYNELYSQFSLRLLASCFHKVNYKGGKRRKRKPIIEYPHCIYFLSNHLKKYHRSNCFKQPKLQNIALFNKLTCISLSFITINQRWNFCLIIIWTNIIFVLAISWFYDDVFPHPGLHCNQAQKPSGERAVGSGSVEFSLRHIIHFHGMQHVAHSGASTPTYIHLVSWEKWKLKYCMINIRKFIKILINTPSCQFT